MKFVAFVLFFSATLIFGTNCAKILGLFHFPSKSHHILGSALLKGLAEKGHQVTMITPFADTKSTIPNYVEVKLDDVIKYKEERLDGTFTKSGFGSFLAKLEVSNSYIYGLVDLTLNSTAVQSVLASNASYDVLVMQWVWNDALLGIAHKIGARVVVFNPVGSIPETDALTGNTSPLSYVPNFLLPFTSEMNFWERLANVLCTITFQVAFKYFANQNQLFDKYFFGTTPPLDQLRDEMIDLVLVNAHYSTESPRPYVPNVIPIGGFHLKDSKGTKGDLKQFLDGAKKGVILFSFGSNIKMSTISKNQLDLFVKVFKNLPMDVLWASDVDITDLPKKVKIERWLPQNDVLGIIAFQYQQNHNYESLI